MAKVDTKLKDATETFSRFEVYVNHKKQIGHILGFLNNDRQAKEKFVSWRVEGDPFNNEYADSYKAAEALCAKNGRKLKLRQKK